MYVKPSEFPNLKLIRLNRTNDSRGSFSTLRNFESNHLVRDGYLAFSRNEKKNTLRGLHSQSDPNSENKLVVCIFGEVYDVILDLRYGTSNFGNWTYLNLGPESEFDGVEIPPNCAHGYLTKYDNTLLFYNISGNYSPIHARNIRWDDEYFSIVWPNSPDHISLSDGNIPLISERSMENWAQ